MTQVAVKTEPAQVSPYRAFADEDNASAIAGDMLTFNKGLWTKGQAKRSIGGDEVFICNLDEGYRGMVRWNGGKPVEYRIGRIAENYQVPSRDELGYEDQEKWEIHNGEPRDPWQPAYRLVMKDHAGELLTFVGSSWGARRGLQMLYGVFARESRGAGIWPVVTLGAEHRQHKVYGVVVEPRFIVVSWSAWDGRINAKQIAKQNAAPAAPVSGGSLSEKLNDSIPFCAEWRA